MKDPAALIYIDKWIAATQGMRGVEKGWYLDLILHQFDKGSVPNDIDQLASICRIRPSEYVLFEQVFEQVLKQKFEQDEDGCLKNPFTSEIIQRRKSFLEKREKSGKWGYVKKFIINKFNKVTDDEFGFIYNTFDFSLDLKNEQVLEQVLTQMLEQKRELYINVDVIVNEDETMYLEYISFINEKTKKNYRQTDKTKKSFCARIKDGYVLEDFKKAVEAAVSDDYHKSEGFKYLTPEFFTRADKLDKFRNMYKEPKPKFQMPENY